MIAPTKTPAQTKFVAIHHSAVKGIPANKEELMRRLRSHESHHSRKGFPNTRGEHAFTFLLYHFAIAGNGEFVQTQDVRYSLWTNTDNYKGAESCNRWGFSILLEGNFEVDTPTPEQLETAAQIIHSWNEVNNTRLIIKGHKEYAAPRFGTLCPGRNMGVSTRADSRLSWIINRVKELGGGEMPEIPESKTAVVTATAGLNLRSGPDTSRKVLVAMRYNSIVEIIGQQGNWLNVIYNGVQGWAYATYLKRLETPQTPPDASAGRDELLLAIQYFNKRLAETNNPQREEELRRLKSFADTRLEST